MANLSDAFGNAAFYAPTPEQVKKVYSFLKEVMDNGGDYSTYFSEEEPQINEFDDGVYEGRCSFGATGRWTYQNNLASLGNGLRSKFNGEPQGLEGFNWWVNFDFFDYEPGCEVFYRATDQLYHHADSPIYVLTYSNLDYENIEISLYNLMQFMGWNESEVLEMCLPYYQGEEFDDFDAEPLEQLLDDLRIPQPYFSEVHEALGWLRKEAGDELLDDLFKYWQTYGFYYDDFGEGASDIETLLIPNLDKKKCQKHLLAEKGVGENAASISEILEGICEDDLDFYLHLPLFELNELLDDAGYCPLSYSKFKEFNKKTYI